MRISDWSSDVCSSDLNDQDVLGKLIKKVLYVGAFAFIIGNFQRLADIIYRSFAGLGITAGVGGLSADDLLHPGAIPRTGFEAAPPMLDKVTHLLGFPDIFGHFLLVVFLLFVFFLFFLPFFFLSF